MLQKFSPKKPSTQGDTKEKHKDTCWTQIPSNVPRCFLENAKQLDAEMGVTGT